MGNQQTKKTELTEDDIRMLEKMSVLKRTQIKNWFENFKKECKNGQLDKKNFARFYKELIPPQNQANADKFCEYVFGAFDKDHSGSIDFTEFLLSFSISAQGDVEDRLNWAFGLYDLDNNNYIDEKEMKKVLKAIYDFMAVNNKDTLTPDQRVNKIFKEIDTNEDKKISRQEFIKGCMRDKFLRNLLAPNL